jgi:hypothetical protein
LPTFGKNNLAADLVRLFEGLKDAPADHGRTALAAALAVLKPPAAAGGPLTLGVPSTSARRGRPRTKRIRGAKERKVRDGRKRKRDKSDRRCSCCRLPHHGRASCDQHRKLPVGHRCPKHVVGVGVAAQGSAQSV